MSQITLEHEGRKLLLYYKKTRFSTILSCLLEKKNRVLILSYARFSTILSCLLEKKNRVLILSYAVTTRPLLIIITTSVLFLRNITTGLVRSGNYTVLLRWDNLEMRRMRNNSLAMLGYKIKNSLVDIDSSAFLRSSDSRTRGTARI